MMSRFTGARRMTSSRAHRSKALRIALQPAPTGGSPMPLAPTGVSGSGMLSAAHCMRSGASRNRGRLVVVEAFGERDAPALVVNPLLADGMGDAQHGAAENLAAERARVDDRAHVRHRQVVEDLVFAGFEVYFDLGEAGDEGVGLAVVRHGIARHAHQALTAQRRGRRRGHLVNPLGRFMSVVNAAQFDGALRGLR